MRAGRPAHAAAGARRRRSRPRTRRRARPPRPDRASPSAADVRPRSESARIACRLRRREDRESSSPWPRCCCVAAGAQAAWSQAGGQAPAPRRPSGSSRSPTGCSSPVYVTSAPGDKRLFVVEQEGTIRTVQQGQGARPSPTPTCGASSTAGGEQGLLSVAFSPNFATNGKLYVYFTNKAGQRGRLGAARAQGRRERPARPPRAAADPRHRGQPQRRPAAVRPRRDALHRRRRRRRRRRSARRARQRAEPRRPARQAAAHRRQRRAATGSPTASPRTTRSSARPAGGPRSGRSACAIRGASRSTARTAISGSATSARTRGRRSTTSSTALGGINFGWNRYEGRHDFAQRHARWPAGKLRDAGGRVQPLGGLQHHGRLRLPRAAASPG